MDVQFQQDPMATYQKSNEDEPMDDNMSTTPTKVYNNGYQESPRRAPAESYPPPNASFSPSLESDTNSRHTSNNSGYQQPQPYSRPSSGLSGGGDRYGHTAYQDQNQNQNQNQNQRGAQQEKTQNNVVIKVGMVGDAQIGKTSLMVKYVEGSWDEDYIQTLGMGSPNCPRSLPLF